MPKKMSSAPFSALVLNTIFSSSASHLLLRRTRRQRKETSAWERKEQEEKRTHQLSLYTEPRKRRVSRTMAICSAVLLDLPIMHVGYLPFVINICFVVVRFLSKQLDVSGCFLSYPHERIVVRAFTSNEQTLLSI